VLAPGTVLLSRFVVDEEVGRGGMGTLYRALDRQTGRRVAVKVLAGGGDEDRFAREARALCALEHASIVKYVGEGRTDGGECLLVMEWVDGEDLAHRLERGPLSITEGTRVCARVATALGYAHRLGVVHRDVKPANLLIAGGDLDQVKLIDFGLVRFLHSGTRATTYNLVLGTPGYLAPEQARGETQIDARADVFALGCVLFECLAGRPVFDGDSVLSILTQVVFAQAPRLSSAVPDVPEILDDFVARMLAKNPDDRPQDGDEVARALGGIQVDLVTPPRVGGTERPRGERRLHAIVLARAAGPTVEDDTAPLLATDTSSWDEIERLVVSHDALLERLADGSIVAVAGSTGAATDQAVRAARIALALRECLPSWRMALATGLGEPSPARFGAVVDRAAGLLGPVGAIRVDEPTAGLLDGRFEIDRHGPASELRGERPSSSGSRLLLGRTTPFVGRDRERTFILRLFDECVAERAGRAALVVGPAGSGKTRLCHEVLRELGARAFVVTARGDDLRAGTPFGGLAPGLRAALGVRDDLPPARRREQLRSTIAERLATSEVNRVVEFVGELVGVPVVEQPSLQLQAARRDADRMSDQMLRAFLDVIVAVGARGPVLIVLEDLQWGDQPSLGFVEAALALDHAPVFALALARPEAREAFPSLLRGRFWQVIDLPPLPSRACRRLVAAVLGEAAAAANADRIVERAAGNPFFLEELIRAEAGGTSDVFPETVLAMMHGRLSALAPELLRTACLASVFGRVFSPRAVEQIGGLSAALDQLTALELVHRRASSTATGQSELEFRHDLVREAAYAMLPDEDRAMAHLGAAEWLERSGPVDSAVLARHLERAGRPERAAVAYLSAARSALDGHDGIAALSHTESCVRCRAPGPIQAEAHLIRGEALWWRGDMVAALQSLNESRSLLGKGSPLLAEVLAWSCRTCARLAARDQAIARATELIATDLRGADAHRVLRAARGAVTSMPQFGRGDLADQILARLRELVADNPAEPVLEAELRLLTGLRALSEGDHWGHVRIIQEVIALQELAGDSRDLLHARINAGFSLAELGALEQSVAMLRRADADATRQRHSGMHAAVWQNLGLALMRQGLLAEARTVLTRSIAAYHAQESPGDEGCSRLYLARVALAEGALEEAEDHTRQTMGLVSGYPPFVALATAVLARIALARGRPTQAVDLASSAMALCDSGVPLEEGQSLVYLALAESLRAVGRVRECARVAAVGRSRIEARAERIGDPEIRAGFLSRVAENAALVALSRALSG